MKKDFLLWWHHDGRENFPWYFKFFLCVVLFYSVVGYIKYQNTGGVLIGGYTGKIGGDVIEGIQMERYNRMMRSEMLRGRLEWTPHFFSGMPGFMISGERSHSPEYFWMPVFTALLVFYCCLVHFAKYGWLVALIIVGLMSQIVVGDGWESWTLLDAIFLIAMGITTQTEDKDYIAERKANHEWYANARR